MEALHELASYIEKSKSEGKKVISIEYVDEMIRRTLDEQKSLYSVLIEQIVS